MTVEVFIEALKFVHYFSTQGTQKELNLFGVGESLLNPNFVELLKLAHEETPKISPIHLNSNGKLITPELIEEFDKYLDQLDLTAHNARDTITAYKMARGHNFKLGMSIDFLTQPNNWAGQVDWFESEKFYPCPWLRDGQAWIMSNGDISTCCFDAFGKGIIGNVFDSQPWELEVNPFSLCETCHQTYERKIILSGG